MVVHKKNNDKYLDILRIQESWDEEIKNREMKDY